MTKCECDFCIENAGKSVTIVHIPPNWTQTIQDGLIARKEAKPKKQIREGFYCNIL